MIDAFHKAGYSYKQIAKEIRRSKSCIGDYLSGKCHGKTRKKPGRPSKLSDKAKRRLLKDASNKMISCKALASQNGLDVSRWTVSRALKNSENIVRQKLKLAPNLTDHHKARRLDFARKEADRNWSQVRRFLVAEL